jgi:hypothetical protein
MAEPELRLFESWEEDLRGVRIDVVVLILFGEEEALLLLTVPERMVGVRLRLFPDGDRIDFPLE